MNKADAHAEVAKRLAERSIQTANREITRLNVEIDGLIRRRTEQERIIEENRLIRDGIRPCDACGRRVQSPCHTKGGMAEHGPWDSHCRGVFEHGR
jgi:hypothetical protein